MEKTLKIMKKNIQKFSYSHMKKSAFTLVEVLITITILGLIFTSVMSVFIYYTTLWAKVEANRLLQSNIKNIIEHISKDIKENGINFWPNTHEFNWLYDGGLPNSDLIWDDVGILYVWQNEYYLAKLNNPNTEYLPWVDADWGRVNPNEYNTKCSWIRDNCALMKEEAWEKIRLSNSWVSFKSMYFYVSKDYIPKVTLNFDMWIAWWKGLKDSVIKANSIQLQTTISEKLLDQNL